MSDMYVKCSSFLLSNDITDNLIAADISVCGLYGRP